MAESFILIAGRTSKQGCGVSEGKFGAEFQAEICRLQVAPEDLARLGLAEGDRVRLTSAAGRVELPVVPAKEGELPPGVLFLAYGQWASRLMGADTHGSGMPTSKGIDVTLEKIA